MTLRCNLNCQCIESVNTPNQPTLPGHNLFAVRLYTERGVDVIIVRLLIQPQFVVWYGR